MLDCFEDIKKTLENAQCPPIELPNRFSVQVSQPVGMD